MNLSRASLISLILGSGLVAGMEGTHSATPSDRLGATRGSDGKIRLRRGVLKGQAALPPSAEDGTILDSKGSVRQRMLKKVQNKFPAKQPIKNNDVVDNELNKVSEKELKMVSLHNVDDWQATVEEIADALREAKKNKYRDECGAACKQCWIALGGRIDDVVFNLQRMTHLTKGTYMQVSFCSDDVKVCKSALDFMRTNAGFGSLDEGQYANVIVGEGDLCLPLNTDGLNVFTFNPTKQQNGDTADMAQSLETCKDETVTLNLDFRAKCATAFDYLGGDIVRVKNSLDSAKKLYEEKYSTSDEDYGVLFCPNGESKNRLQIQSIIEAFWYLSWTLLNDEEVSRFDAEYPWMTYWKDSGLTPTEGPRLMNCDKLFL